VTQLKRHDTAQVDVPMPDRRDVGEDIIGKGAWIPFRCPLNVVRVPGHHDIRQQGQGPRDRFELLSCSPALRGNGAVVDGSLEAVHGLALVEKIQYLVSELAVAEVVAEIQGQQQLAEGGASFIDGIAPRGGAISVQGVGRRIPAVLDRSAEPEQFLPSAPYHTSRSASGR
jgi:hypothetical protein